jgi:hypothetical protein
MTNSKLKIIFLVCLLGMSFAVSADDRSRRDGFRGGETGQWRLGGDRGSRGYEIYHRDGRGWRRVPGSALDIGDGWVIGTDRRGGGYGIYRWNGRRWDRVSGGAVEIGGTYNRPWIVNNRNERFVWNGYDWDRSGQVGRQGPRGKYNQGFAQRDQRNRKGRDRRRWN